MPLGSLAPPCLKPCAIFACEVIILVKSTRCSRGGTLVLESSNAVPPQGQLGYFLFGSVARLPGIGGKQLGMERTTTSNLVPLQPFQPGRNKLLRHALSLFRHVFFRPAAPERHPTARGRATVPRIATLGVPGGRKSAAAKLGCRGEGRTLVSRVWRIITFLLSQR